MPSQYFRRSFRGWRKRGKGRILKNGRTGMRSRGRSFGRSVGRSGARSWRKKMSNTARSARRTVSKWYKIISDRVAVPATGYSSVGNQVCSLSASGPANAEAAGWCFYKITACLVRLKWQGQLADAQKVGATGATIIDPATGVVSYSSSAYSTDGLKVIQLNDMDGYRGETTSAQLMKDPRSRVKLLRPNGRPVSMYAKYGSVLPLYAGATTTYGWVSSKRFVSTDYPAVQFYGMTIGMFNDSQKTVDNAAMDREVWMKVTFKTEKDTFPRRHHILNAVGTGQVHGFGTTTATEEPVDIGALPYTNVNNVPDDPYVIQPAE